MQYIKFTEPPQQAIAADTPIKIALYIHRGRDTCVNRALALINMAKNAIYLTCTDSDFLEIFYEDMKKARARGVTDLRMIIVESDIEDEKFRANLEKYSEICILKSRDQVFGNSVIIDEGEDAFIILTQRVFKKLSYFGAITDHIAFGPASLYYFSYLWDTADEVEL